LRNTKTRNKLRFLGTEGDKRKSQNVGRFKTLIRSTAPPPKPTPKNVCGRREEHFPFSILGLEKKPGGKGKKW